MNKAKPPTPAEYDRWGRTCVKFYEDTPKKAGELEGLPATNAEAATAEPKPPPVLEATV